MKHTYLALPFLTVSSFAFAEDAPNDIERIQVTGDFRQTTLDQLSASASIVSSDRLAARQEEHLDSMLNIAPNVNFAAGASRGRFIQIRGIGERSQFAEPINPSVSFLVDDFDFSGLAAAGILFDTQQVEVYRGPQATVFGTGALAGAVKIVSNDVGEAGRNFVRLRAGNKNTFRVEGSYGADISSETRYRAAVVNNQSDGFTYNTYLDKATNSIDETGVRLAIEHDFANRTTVALNYRFYDVDNGYDAFSLDNDGKTLSDEPGFDEHQTHAVSAHSTTQTQQGQFDVILTHASHNIAYGYDEDWTYVGFHPWEYSSFDAYYRDVDTQTAEMRFTSSDNARLFNDTTNWVIGTHFKTSEESLLRQYTYADGDFASEYSPTTISAYVQFDTQLSSQWLLTTALRAENYEFEYADNAGLSHTHDDTMVGGKIAIHYVMSDDQFWYGSISRGYKGAGFNQDERVSDEKRFFEAEYNWNYEVGYKGSLSDNLHTRVAVFYMDRENTQVNDFDVQIREDGTPDFIDIIDNADLGTNRGIEAELNLQATDNWSVQLAVGYLDATFESYTNAAGEEIEEQRQAQAPKYTANLFSQLVITDNISWNFDVDYKDEYRFSDGHDVTSPSTTLVNSELVWQVNQWQTSLWVKNAFDRTYYVRGFGGFSNDPRDYYEFDEPYYQLGNGRQFGVSVTYDF